MTEINYTFLEAKTLSIKRGKKLLRPTKVIPWHSKAIETIAARYNQQGVPGQQSTMNEQRKASESQTTDVSQR